MIGKTKKNKKGIVSEEDISTLLQRYTATAVLTLLQEVAQFEGTNIDWNALVKRTKTGISNPREYQMLWRHLAYRHSLLDNLEDGAQPLDDDSDLEYEVEAFPDVPSEASAEAAACVKVLMASGLSRDLGLPNNAMVEAPLTINIPNGQSCRPASEISQPTVMHGINITVPVSVQKQTLPAVNSAEGLDTNRPAGGTIPPRRKRKLWSEAEDMELIAAVQKFGEGNWANILRSEFKGDRTASQLSQRWSIIRKKQCNLNLGANSGGLQLSEEQQATRHAINLALDPLAKNSIKNSCGGATVNNTFKNTVPPTATAETPLAQHQSQPTLAKSSSIIPSVSAAKSHEESPKDSSALRTNGGKALNGTSNNSVLSTTVAKASTALLQSQQCPITTKSPSAAPLGSATLKKQSIKADLSSDPVRAAAVAAGARIATQSDAASLLKAQAKNAVRIMPTGGSLMKQSICGLAATALSSRSAVSSSVSHANLVKPSSSGSLATPLPSTKSLSSKQTNAELPERPDAEHAEGKKISQSEDEERELVKADEACALANEPSGLAKQGKEGVHLVKESEEALPNNEAEFKSQAVVAESSHSSMRVEMSGVDNGDKGEESKNANAGDTKDLPVKEVEFQPTVQENGDYQSISDRQTNMDRMASDECDKTLMSVSKEEPCDGTS